MKTAVNQMIKELQEQFPKEMGDMYERNQLLLEDIALRAKEMEREYKCRFANEYADNVMAGMMKTAEDYLTEYETFKSE